MSQMRTIGINLDRGYRNDLNFNFSKLETMVTSASNLTDEMRDEFLLKIADLQSQINALKVEEILALISQMEQAVINTNTAAAIATSKAEYAEVEGDYAKDQGDYAKAQGTYANEKGDYANEKAVLAIEAANLATQESANLGQMKIDVVQATQDAVTETQKAISATENAEQATTATIVATTNAENMHSVGAFVLPTAYKKNNIVEDNGSSFIALQNTQNNPLPVLPNKSNAWWRLHAQKGDKGNDGTGVTILGSLANESELPPVGSPGDAYLVDGFDVDNNPIKNLYVWSDSTTSWTNAGNIQGPQGEPGQGIQGEKGDPGTTTWSGITDKPTAFPPSAHAHTIPQITGLEDALELKFTVADGGELDDLTTVTKDNLVAAINEINAKPTGGDTTGLEKRINTLYNLSTSLLRSDALRTLREDAEGILEDGRGTIFAHDMDGNIIGMTLDEANSQNIVIRDGKMLMLAKSEVTKTVTDATVVASAYDTSGNGGRKLVRLSNGKLALVVKSTTHRYLYKSENNGLGWTLVREDAIVTQDTCLVAIGNKLFMFTSYINVNVNYNEWDLTTNTLVRSGFIDSGQTSLGGMSAVANPEGTELHVWWASKNAAINSSFNIRYAKGVISQVDGSVTWGTVEQVTTRNANNTFAINPSGFLDSNGIPCVIIEQNSAYLIDTGGVGTGNAITILKRSNELIGTAPIATLDSRWTFKVIHPDVTYAQSNPSAIFVPKSVNGLANGRIWVAWEGRDTASLYVAVRYSDDGGFTWSALTKLNPGGTNMYSPSITANNKNEIFIAFRDGTNGYLKYCKYTGSEWLPGVTIKSANVAIGASTLFDITLDFTFPLVVFRDSNTGGKVVFYGTWKEPLETPSLTAKAVYDIPSTDYVGAFVKKVGTTTVQAYVNDVLADAELVDNEYQFVKQLDAEAPVKLRLELSRASVSGGENDAVTRILGGRA